MKRPTVQFSVAAALLAIGGLFGYLLGTRTALPLKNTASPRETHETKGATARAANSTGRSSLRSSVDSDGGPRTAKVRRLVRSNDCRPWIAASKRLRHQLIALEERFGDYVEQRRYEGTEPLPFPEDLDNVFREDEVAHRFTSAFAEAGIEGAIEVVDCAEYPCMIYGTLSSKDDLERLYESAHLAPYSEAGRSDGTGTTPDGGTQFHIAVYPRSDGQKVAKRVKVRFGLMYDELFGEN